MQESVEEIGGSRKDICSSVIRMRLKAYRGNSRMRNRPPPWDPTVGPCLGPHGDPRRVGVSFERGTPVGAYAGPVSRVIKKKTVTASSL
jgi:hypothetical protein